MYGTVASHGIPSRSFLPNEIIRLHPQIIKRCICQEDRLQDMNKGDFGYLINIAKPDRKSGLSPET